MRNALRYREYVLYAAAFFDYLTYPLLTLSMPLVIWLLTYDKPDADMLKKEFYYSACCLFLCPESSLKRV